MERLVLAILALALLLRYPVHFLLHPPFLMDFEVYRAVAQRALTGEAAALYAPTTAGSDMMMFRYAPPWALLWAPLGWLPPLPAAIAWTAGSVGALIAALIFSARSCQAAGLRPHALLALPAAFAIIRPLAEEMGNGQVNLLWIALIAGAVLATLRGRRWLAGCAFASAILLKLPAAVYLPYFVARGQRWLAAATAGLAALATLVASALLLPSRPLQLALDWTGSLIHSGAHTFDIGNQSILALLGRLLTADRHGLNIAVLPRAILPWLALALLAACFVLIAVPARSRQPSRQFLFESAMLAVVMVLFSPSAWLATYAALVFPAYVACAGLAQPQARRDRAAVACALVVLLLVLLTHHRAWTLMGLTSWRGETYLFLVFMVLPWTGLALLALLWRLRRRLAPAAAAAAGTRRSAAWI